MKRHYDNDESEPNKSQRIDSTDEPEDTIKIVDLSDFCLIKIFENLEVQSLVNVAIANGRLRPAAIDVHQRKFGKKPVKICGFRHSLKGRYGGIRDGTPQRRDSIIKIFGLRACLQFLRCFGSFVGDLRIHYDHNSEGTGHEYVNEYINIAIGQFQKIFTNVQSVDISDCALGQQLSTFVRCFPNVRRFKAIHTRFYDRFTQKPFRYLEHLNLNKIRCDGFKTSHFVADLLNGIHDLKSLKVTKVYGGSWSLLDLIKDNTSITKLNCSFGHGIPLRSDDVKRIAAEHPALIKLKLPGYQFTADDTIALVQHLNSLKRFRFWMKGLEYARLISQLNDEWKAITISGDRIPGMYIFNRVKVTLKR